MMERFSTPSYALGLLGLAMAVIPLNDALIKIMSASISLGQVVAVRALLSLILVLLVSDGLRAYVKSICTGVLAICWPRNVSGGGHVVIFCIAWQSAFGQCDCHIFCGTDDHHLIICAISWGKNRCPPSWLRYRLE